MTRPALLVLAVALALRCLNAVFLPWQEGDLIVSDMKGYDRAAVALLRQGPLPVHTVERYLYHPLGSDTYHPPGYYYFLAGIYGLFGHSYLAVRIAQALLDTVTCLLIYLLAKEAFGPIAGLIAGLVAAAYPPLIFYTGVLLTETLTTFLLTAAALCVLSLARFEHVRRQVLLLLAGLLLGLAIITRSVFLVTVPLVLLWLLTLAEGWRGWSSSVRRTLSLLVPIVLVIIPITVRNWQIHGRFVLISTNGGVNFFLAHGGTEQEKNEVRNLPPEWSEGEVTGISSRTQPEEEAYFYQLGWEYLRGHLLPTLRSLPGKLRNMYWTSDYWPASSAQIGILHSVDNVMWRVGILPLSMLSLPLFHRQEQRRALLFVLLILSTLIIPLIFWAQPRFRLPVVPSFIVLAAGSAATLCRHLAQQSAARRRTIRL
jgi:4-amino-4-deoxy-L-arabinose transferase-like glycosyltransferase